METLFTAPGNQYDFAIVVQVSSLSFLLGYWVLSIVLTRVLENRSRAFREMDIRHRRNVVTYVMEIAATTYTFVALTAFLPRLITVTRIEEPLGDTDIYLAATASSSIIYLYIFELIYKTSIGAELAMHHLLAISSIACVAMMLRDTANPAAAYPMVLLYSAITEQSVFVALLRYRFGLPCYHWFKFSAVFGVVAKTVTFALTWLVLKRALVDVEFVNNDGDWPWKTFMIVFVSVINTALFFVQMYSVRIYMVLANKSRKQLGAQKTGPPTDHAGTDLGDEGDLESGIACTESSVRIPVFEEDHISSRK